MASRKNEIKKDLFQILCDVYGINLEKGITDKQNEFLDKVVLYLDANLSLRRKGEKKGEVDVEDNSPLERPPPRVMEITVDPEAKTGLTVSRKKGTIKAAPEPKPVKSTPVTPAPVQAPKPAPVVAPVPSKVKPAKKPAKNTGININALPEHLRKFLK